MEGMGKDKGGFLRWGSMGCFWNFLGALVGELGEVGGILNDF